jgi:glutathione S-transferase
MIRLYDSRFSGNSWKIRILLNQLGLPFERVTLDLVAGETNTESFRQISRFSRIPALRLDDGRTLVESGAILLHLAEGSALLPSDSYLRSEVTSWLFFEQGDIQKALALARMYHIRGLADRMSQQIERLHGDGYPALEKLERCLSERRWLVDDRYTIADLAVSVYVSLAPEGGFELGRFPSIQRWLSLVAGERGWLGIFDESPFQVD